MSNITISFSHRGELHELEFIAFRFNTYYIYQVCKSSLGMLPEGIRFTEAQNFSKHLTRAHESIQIDPRIQTPEARIAYFQVYAAILQRIEDETQIEFTSSIASVYDYNVPLRVV